jgi:RNA polymerase sigma-70 factor (ECF subfamily)
MGGASVRFPDHYARRVTDGLAVCVAGEAIVTDEELMLAAGRGDLHAFGQLVERHQTSAWNAAFRFLGNAADAEDIAQEAFLRVLDAAPRYRAAAKFRTFLYRILTRLCIDFSRRKVIRVSNLESVLDHRAGPIESAVSEERSNEVRNALMSLPDRQRMAVVLRYYENLGHHEIAAALGTTAKGAERLLSRARSLLEPLLVGLRDGE